MFFQKCVLFFHRCLSLLILSLGFVTCTNKEAPPQRDKLVVLSTTTLMKDLVDIVWGDQVYSEGLMGPGVDPHLYQPTAQDLTKLKNADMIIAHGLNLEGKLLGAIESVGKSKSVVIVGQLMDPKNLISAEATVDPHIWFDPDLWVLTAEILSQNSPSPSLKPASLNEFKEKVAEISKKYKEAFQKIPKERRVLITSHDAFSYLGRYFDIDVEGVQGVSTDAEVGIKRVEELIALIKKRKIASVFTETSVSPRSIEKLLSESGAKKGGTLYSDALGPMGSGAESYLSMLEKNLNTILEGLK